MDVPAALGALSAAVAAFFYIAKMLLTLRREVPALKAQVKDLKSDYTRVVTQSLRDLELRKEMTRRINELADILHVGEKKLEPPVADAVTEIDLLKRLFEALSG
ncbi:MAG: hypothetical protein M0R66_03880 [Candidatus Omnitrophica bacterium]|nr:hypothetical protein [Candidatus Omnitrophota bacterium]